MPQYTDEKSKVGDSASRFRRRPSRRETPGRGRTAQKECGSDSKANDIASDFAIEKKRYPRDRIEEKERSQMSIF